MKASVVLPLGPDARSGWVSRILDRLAEAGGFEVVCVDSSEAGEDSLLSGRCDRVVRLKTRSRGARFRSTVTARRPVAGATRTAGDAWRSVAMRLP